MSLEQKINDSLKEAMKSKDQAALRALRAIKSAILLAKTEEGAGEINDADEIKILSKRAKQRRESLDIFEKEGRDDLASKEREELEIITQFLPEQLSEEELRTKLKEIVSETGASSMKDMGRVMGEANKQFAGKADGKMIATIVKNLLS